MKRSYSIIPDSDVFYLIRFPAALSGSDTVNKHLRRLRETGVITDNNTVQSYPDHSDQI